MAESPPPPLSSPGLRPALELSSSRTLASARALTVTSVPPVGNASSLKTPAPLELNVSIRRGRVTLLTVAMVSFLLLMVYTFSKGIELKTFKDSEKTPKQQTKLLDDYNSYSGNVASLFGTPVELFVGAAVHVILLRFMTRAITAEVSNWKMKVVSVAVGALAAYLISNGFNALNVQLRPRGIDLVISAEDLSANVNQSIPGLTTNLTHSYSEIQANNPITNTILRNAVLPRVLTHAYCTDGVEESVPTIGVEFGFRQREWQSRLLPQALPAQQLRVVVTPTNITLKDGATSADMPMNASTAADLYLYGMFLMVDQFKTGRNFVNTTEIRAHYPLFSASPFARLDYPKYANISLAKLLMVLPPDDQGITEETAQRDYFLKKSTSGLRSHFAAVVNTSTSEFNMTFSHVQVADNIKFESITFDFEVDPMMMANTSTKGNATRFTDISMVACAATPGTCLMQKALYGNDDYQYDPPAQIKAFGQCLNDVGTPELRAYWFTGQYPDSLECSGSSNTSFLVFSVGKRITADVFTVNHTAQYGNIDSKTSGLRYSENDHVATNVRKFFTVTIFLLLLN